MKKKAMFLALAGAAALGGCDAKFGDNADFNEAASAEGQSQENTLSISAPGFDMKLKLPEGVRSNSDLKSDEELFYPGASFAGMHIQAKDESGGVEIRFSSADATDKVLAWYRDRARTGFTIDSDTRDGAATLLAGEAGTDKDRYKLRLTPAAGGGTEGVLTIIDNRG